MTSETVRRLTELRDEWLRQAKVKNRDQFRLYWDGFGRGLNQAAEDLDSILRQIREDWPLSVSRAPQEQVVNPLREAAKQAREALAPLRNAASRAPAEPLDLKQ